MFQVNDTVLYGGQSVCTITEICEKKVGGQTLQYYALKPVFDNKSTIYVPCGNGKLVEKMHRILSASEIRTLIDSLRNQPVHWIENDTERKEKFSEMLYSGDRKALFMLVRTLYLHKETLKSTGKKFHAADEQILDRAKKLLHEEFAYVLQIQPDEVPPFIADQLEASGI